MNIELLRIEKTNECTVGVMRIDGMIKFVTLELPYLNNQHSVSCIPVGDYTCKRHSSEKFPNTFELVDVPDRDKILIHFGNTSIDTHGCILIGKQFGYIDGHRAILNSKQALDELRQLLINTPVFELKIKEV